MRRRIVVAAALAAMLSSPVHAAAPVPVQWIDNAGNAITTQLGLKSLPTQEQFPSYGKSRYLPSQISCVMVCVNDNQLDNPAGTWTNRDSTSVIPTDGYKYAALLMWVRPTPIGGKGTGSTDSLMGEIYALQVRSHQGSSADSASTYRQVSYTRRFESSPGGAVAVNDTIGMLRDLLMFTNTPPAAIRTTALPDEKIVVAGNMAGPFGGFVAWAGRINDPSTGFVTGFMSWRLRNIKSFTNISGSPGNPATELPAQVRCDLYLWND